MAGGRSGIRPYPPQVPSPLLKQGQLALKLGLSGYLRKTLGTVVVAATDSSIAAIGSDNNAL